MPHYETERHVAHSAGDMFSLVGDVERYPEFVPFCERLVVRARRQDGSAEVIVADMTVGYRAIRETFTTRVVLDRSSLVVSAQYLEGPFRHLDSRWLFTPDGPGKCRIHFSIDYEFRSRMLALLMGSLFDKMFRRFVEAFEAQADAVYGKAATLRG
jgi:coenzyme Q-binding protein COQ10